MTVDVGCRRCSICKETLPLTDFYKGDQSRCKICHKQYCKDQGYQSYEYVRNRQLKRRYKITLEQYNKLAASQNNRCAICNIHASDCYEPLNVDHDHATSKVRGLLCHKCNRGLGHFDDSPDLLLKAKEYVS